MTLPCGSCPGPGDPLEVVPHLGEPPSKVRLPWTGREVSLGEETVEQEDHNEDQDD